MCSHSTLCCVNDPPGIAHRVSLEPFPVYQSAVARVITSTNSSYAGVREEVLSLDILDSTPITSNSPKLDQANSMISARSEKAFHFWPESIRTSKRIWEFEKGSWPSQTPPPAPPVNLMIGVAASVAIEPEPRGTDAWLPSLEKEPRQIFRSSSMWSNRSGAASSLESWPKVLCC